MNTKSDHINKSRITKTKLFFENRDLFMDILIKEIISGKLKAKKLGLNFSVRLNNTSDLHPNQFYKIINGKKVNILELFPDINFYDYTKVPNRINMVKKYPNYHLTFSYSGWNIKDCLLHLRNNINVAVVFDEIPTSFMGIEVIDGDQFDMRYHDKKGVIVGLKYKRVKSQMKVPTNNRFVVITKK